VARPGFLHRKDLSYERVGNEAVVVTGTFEWGLTAETRLTFSYPSLLLYRNGQLKIRLEDESMAPPPAQ